MTHSKSGEEMYSYFPNPFFATFHNMTMLFIYYRYKPTVVMLIISKITE